MFCRSTGSDNGGIRGYPNRGFRSGDQRDRSRLPQFSGNGNAALPHPEGKYFGYRCMLAIVANKVFDNPYLSYEPYTDFNRSPYYLGYYALGTYIYGVVQWLLNAPENKGYDKIHFVARDGYIAKLVYDELSKNIPNAPKSNYFYMSRKSFIPLLVATKQDLYNRKIGKKKTMSLFLHF